MKKEIFVDKNYNIVKKIKDSYSDEVDEKIDLVLNAIEKGTITKEDGVELLKFVLSKDFENDLKHIISSNMKTQKIRNNFVFLLKHMSSIERYAA